MDDFAAPIRRLLEYDNHLARPQDSYEEESSFIMSGCRLDAKMDVCMIDHADYLLVQDYVSISLYATSIRGLVNDELHSTIHGSITLIFN